MEFSNFDGEEDAYWWILCTEKYFKAKGTSEAVKMIVVAMAMRGPALKWWLWWSHRHPNSSWDTFTTSLLWRFKPEWRPILPILHEETEPTSCENSATEETIVASMELRPASTDLVNSPTTRRSLGTFEGNHKSTIPTLDMPSLNSSESNFNATRNSLSTIVKLPISPIIPAFPYVETTFRVLNPPIAPPPPKPPNISFEQAHSVIPPPPKPPESELSALSHVSSQTTTLSLSRENHSTPSKPPKPPDLVLIPPPPLASPWIYHSVYPRSLDSPPLINVSYPHHSFQFECEGLTKTPFLYDKAIDSQSKIESSCEAHHLFVKMPPEPRDGVVLPHFLPLEPPNSVDVQNYLMLSSPPKPPDLSFQLKQEEFQVTWDLTWPPPPPEPPDVDHIVVILQGFLTLKFPKLTDLSSLHWNRYNVTGLLPKSLRILSQHVVLDAKNQQWNFAKVSYQDSGEGNVNLDEMCNSYGNSGTPVVNYTPHVHLPFHAFGADINQHHEMCADVLQHCKILCSLVDVIPCINAITSCFSRFEYSKSGSLHLGRKVKFDVYKWIQDLPVLRIDNFQRVTTPMKCFGQCPKSIGVSLVHYAGLVLARTLNMRTPSRMTKGDSYFRIHKKLTVEPFVIILPVKKLAAATNFLFALLNKLLVFDRTSKKKNGVRNDHFYIHGNNVFFVWKLLLSYPAACNPFGPSKFGLLGQLCPYPTMAPGVVSLDLKKSSMIPTSMSYTNVEYIAIPVFFGTNVLVLVANHYMLSMSNNIHTIITFTPLFFVMAVLSLIKIRSQHLHSQCGAAVDHDVFDKAAWLNIGKSSKLVVNIAFDLEDKIFFRGDGNDMIYCVLVQCLLTNMFYNEEIICDITNIEVEKRGKTMHKGINRLWCCYKICDNKCLVYEFIPNASLIDALNVKKNLLAWHYNCSPSIVIDAAEELAYLQQNCILPIVHKYMWSTKEISEVAKVIFVSMGYYGYIPLMSSRKRTKWDPGGHLGMCTTNWSFKFKQWDPGKFCVVSNFYNLEDKVGFEGVDIVMNKAQWQL